MTIQPVNQPPTLGLAGFVRLSGDPETITDTLGPLSHLVGTWIGNHGWNMIAVPNGPKGFTLLVRPYYEMITFTSLGALVPNRGGVETMLVPGLQYDLRISDAETNQPLHLENGMWLLLNDPLDPNTPSIARLATVPHGDSVLALGDYSVVDGPPTIPDINAIPDAGQAPLGYFDVYNMPMEGFNKSNPNQNLQAVIKEQNIVETITLNVSTQNGGGISNIPFIVKHANASAFQGTFWIEKIKNQDTGVEFEQLQYSQQTNIDFLPKFGATDPSDLIMWPHVNVNTLVKQ